MTSDQYRMKLKPASEAFGVGYMALWTAIKEGELAAVQLGRHWLVRPEDVEQWIQDNGKPNAAEEARTAS